MEPMLLNSLQGAFVDPEATDITQAPPEPGIAAGVSAATVGRGHRFNMRHFRFAWGLYLFGWNRSKAARYAGYVPKWAGTNTARLMKHPGVQAEIEEIREALFGPREAPRV
jgi:terminase small subunit-like protein